LGKFILIAFGFLGLSFYELSGGADFDPEALRLSRVEAGPIKQGLPKIAQATADKGQANAAVTAVDLAVSEKVKEVVSAPQQSIPEQSEPVEVTQAAFTPLTTEEPAGSIILPSLIVPSQTAVSAPEPTTQLVQEVRFVSGNRVNVRGGPGTNFDVVGSLTRGSEVVVLAENGEGWVEMQSLDGATIGWMADFLLEKG
jgi:hypothetical protein